ncbi:MAG: hypothetical protein ACTIDN_05000 [Acetobacter sp.]|uniref:hypothetical protein n=1 Tax=Acetobacter sp. TaxID=440 RepID=UPI003F8E3F4F
MTNDNIETPESAKLPWIGLSSDALLKIADFIGLHCVEADIDIEDVSIFSMGAVTALNALAFCGGAFVDSDEDSFERQASTFHEAILKRVSAKDKISSIAIFNQIKEAFRKGDAS